MNKEIIFKRLLFQPIYKHYHGFTDFTMNAFRWEDKVENQPWFIKGPNHRNIMSLISHDGNLKNCLGDEANEKDSPIFQMFKKTKNKTNKMAHKLSQCMITIIMAKTSTSMTMSSSSVIFALFLVIFVVWACHIWDHSISCPNITYLLWIIYQFGLVLLNDKS